MKLPSFRLPRLTKSLALRLAVVPIVASLIVMAALQFGIIGAHAENPTLSQDQDEILSGFASYELNPANANSSPKAAPKNYSPSKNDGCGTNVSSNSKVNQNCENVSDPDLAGRGEAQNETSIAIDPNNPNHLLASYNDYRRGDGTCGVSYSTDNGHTWTDSTVPNGFTRGNGTGEANFGAQREYWQAGGDTSVAFDTKGNAYLSCQLFNRGFGATSSHDTSSAFVVFRSTGNGGASWNFPGRYAAVFANTSGSTHVRVNLLDKQLMTVDNHVGSPFQDRIYVTWTEFTRASGGNNAFIYEAYSTDYGETFSGRHLVSKNSAYCPSDFGVGTTAVTGETSHCTFNQFSEPFTGPDGALYVTYTNFNNGLSDANDNRNQFLLVKSTDGGNTFSDPVKVSDFYDLPDCLTYQGSDAGRACVPEKGSAKNSVFRATNYSSGAVNPTNPNQIAVTFGSYINKDSNESNGCAPQSFSSTTGNNLFTGVKTAGACNNKILISVSNDGGASFTGTSTDPRNEAVVNTDAGQTTTDQFWQWEAFTKDGKLAVSYYDRQYGDDETTGAMDISLSGSKDLANFGVQRATSSSMPLPTEFPDANGNSQFFGDYTGLAAYNDAHPLWMDTRDPEFFACTSGGAPAICTATYTGNGLTANDEDIFTVGMGVPTK
ncbi:MAG TPA: sialidase family protein [Ktedonobacterales bacterium]